MIPIAKNELRHLFYAPVAWFVALLFLVFCAFTYTTILQQLAPVSEAILRRNPDLAKEVLTSSSTAYVYQLFFNKMLSQLYLFIPVLTMGAISREFNNETYRLLYSSPVTTSQIVLGKFLALMIYNLLLLLIIAIFIVAGFFNIKELDYPQALSASLGIYLLLCALSAIGLFMSGLTRYPIVAAIASFSFLFVLMYIGKLWQQFDFVRDLTAFLSIQDRTGKMIAGLVRTKDIIYYLVIISMFIGLTILKLRGGKETRAWYIKAGRYILIVAAGLMVGYLGSRPRLVGYWDATATKSNTIHPRTQEVLQEFDDSTLEITLYTNLLSNDVAKGLPKARNTYLNIWEPYTRFLRNVQFRYEYFYALQPGNNYYFKQFPGKSVQQIVGLIAKGLQVDSALFKSPEEMREKIDLKDPQNYSLFLTLQYKGRKVILRSLPGKPGLNLKNGSTEPHMIALFRRLLGEEMPKIAFVSGALERSIYKRGEREYRAHTLGSDNALINLGFDVDTLNLNTQEIPKDISVLVLADPKRELSAVVQQRLRQYIHQGRNLFILGEPGKQYVLNPVLQQLGVALINGQLVQPSANETPDKISSKLTPAYLYLAEEPKFLSLQRWLTAKVPPATAVTLQGATGISFTTDSGFVIKPILLTQRNKTWSRMGPLVIDSTAPSFNPAEGDLKDSSFRVALQVTRRLQHREQRIVVYGDADVASTLRLLPEEVRAVYSWLVYNRFPVYTMPPPAKDNMYLITRSKVAVQKVIFIWVLPGLLLVAATVLLIRRKRK